MSKLRLFERIENDLTYNENYNYSEEVIIKSITDYLKQILSLRKGTTKVNLNLGMEDLHNISKKEFGEFVTSIVKDLEDIIKSSEPRLKNVYVEYVGKFDNIYYLFKIEAQLANTTTSQVIFTAKINDNGDVLINE